MQIPPFVLDHDLPKPLFTVLLLLLTCVCGGRALAAQVQGLYSASVPVASQQARDRDAAFNEALKRVLVKVTGQHDLLQNEAFLQALLPAQPYIQTFSYRENPDYQAYIDLQATLEERTPNQFGSDPAEQALFEALAAEEATILALPEQVPEPYVLDASFAKGLVDAKLTEWRIPVWGEIRPSLMLWAVMSSAGERELLSSANPRTELPKAAAREFAIPIITPVMDLSDTAAIDIDELWGLFPDAVSEAAMRYQPDTQLLVRINAPSSGGKWRARWNLLLRQNIGSSAEFETENIEDLWREIFAHVSRELSQRYAVLQSRSDVSALVLEVEGVQNFGDYVALREYLQGMPAVAGATLLWVNRDILAYRVTLAGTREQFDEFLELGGRLEQMDGTATPVLPPLSPPSNGALFNAPEVMQGPANAAVRLLWRTGN